jgi:hypothetical protein
MDLETHGVLYHDLLHFAVETEAGLHGSFYGLLAKVGGYAELTLSGEALGGEAQITEIVVGALTGVFKQTEPDAPAAVAQMRDYMQDIGARPPAWLTAEFVLQVKDRLRQLKGRWKATPFGETMELGFPLER